MLKAVKSESKRADLATQLATICKTRGFGLPKGAIVPSRGSRANPNRESGNARNRAVLPLSCKIDYLPKSNHRQKSRLAVRCSTRSWAVQSSSYAPVAVETGG